MNTQFIILWHKTSTWEYVPYFEYGGHGYAWDSPQYGDSEYSIIQCDRPPEKFIKTPEDKLLDEIFKED